MSNVGHGHNGRLSLHRQIKEALERDITEGTIAADERLPSEAYMMLRFGVSRHVVRQALTELAKEGLIHTERGRGSFANPPKQVEPITTLSSYHRLMAEKGLQPDIDVVRNRVAKLPASMAERLGMGTQDQAVELVRVARIRNERALLMVSHLPLVACGRLTEQDMTRVSLYEYLEAECGLRLARAENYIETGFASREQAELLGIAVGAVLLVIEGLVYDQNDRPVELSQVFYRGDRFRLFFESFRVGTAAMSTIILGR